MTQLVLPQTIDAGTEIVASELQSNFIATRDLINGQLEGGATAAGNIKANGITAREIEDNFHLSFNRMELQAGVLGAGDFKVTPGSGLQLAYAAGTAWVSDTTSLVSAVFGTYMPVQIASGSTVTIAANASGNPRIDQIILTLTGYNTGTVSVLQGTATSGATLANRSGAAALATNAIRLADILMPTGFGGPFIAATHVRDRRPWARGAFYAVQPTNITGASWSGATAYDIGIVRLEIGGTNPVTLMYQGGINTTVTGAQAAFRFLMDGAVMGNAANNLYQYRIIDNSVYYSGIINYTVPVAAGSHEFRVQMIPNVATLGSIWDSEFTIIEHIRQNSDNSGA